MGSGTVPESYQLGDEIALEMQVESIDGEDLDLDIECRIDGTWWIASVMRHEFAKKMEALIIEYRV
jgi:hypothetical protein